MKQSSTYIRLLYFLNILRIYSLLFLLIYSSTGFASVLPKKSSSVTISKTLEAPTVLSNHWNFKTKTGLNLEHVDCQDSLIVKLPSKLICAGEEFEIGVEFQSENDVLWFATPFGGTAFDTTKFGEKTKLVLEGSVQYFLQQANRDSSCVQSRIPISFLVNPTPSLPVINSRVSICQDSLVDPYSLLLFGSDNASNYFVFYTDSLKLNQVVGRVGAGKYFVFQESNFGCSSLFKEFQIAEDSCGQEPMVDLSLLKSANKRTVTLGAEVEYTITIKNSSLNNNATNVEVLDVLPAGLRFVSSSHFIKSGDSLKLKIDTVYANSSVPFTYKVRTEKLGNLVNFAEIVYADQKDPNSVAGNGVGKNEDDDDDEAIQVYPTDTTVKTADLSIQKRVNKQVVKKGESVMYTIRVTNAGPNAATNVYISDTLASGLQLVKTSGEVNGKAIVAKFDSLSSNSYAEFSIEARAESLGQIINKAEIIKSDQYDPDFIPGKGGEASTVSIRVIEACEDMPVPLISTQRSYICSGESITLMAVGCSNVLWSTGQVGLSIQLSPSVSTTYSAVCYVGDCMGKSSNNLVITIDPTARPSIVASALNICVGEEVILTATGCSDQVIWSDGTSGKSIAVRPNKTTKYTAECVGGACVGNKSNELEITVKATPTGDVTALGFITNSCPENFINLNQAILAYPANSTLVFKGGSLPSSSEIDSLVYTKGLFFAFAKYSNGCFSKGVPITVNVDTCETSTADVSLDLWTNKEEIHVGDTLAMQLAIENHGPDTAIGNEVTSTLPKGFSLVQSPLQLNLTGDNLVWSVSELEKNHKDSISFRLKVNDPGLYRLKAEAHSTALVDPNLANNQSSRILKVLENGPCLAAALHADTLKIDDSTYQLTLSTYVMNCGDQTLGSVRATLDLVAMLNSALHYDLINAVAVNPESSLIPNDRFNGGSNMSLVMDGSSLDAGDVDTITITYRVNITGLNDVFYLNTLVSGHYGPGELISDISNNGESIVRNLNTSTPVSFDYKSGLASILNVKSVVSDETGKSTISFQALFKNIGIAPISSILVSDSLSKYFKLPVSYTVSGLRSTGSLVTNPDYDGITNTQLTLISSTLAAGKLDTLEYQITLSNSDTSIYYNQLYTSAVLGGDAVKVLSHWTKNINERGVAPTQIILDVAPKEDYCIGLGLAAVDKIWQADGSINISYQATLGNCGKKAVQSISLCDSINQGLSDSATVTLVTHPQVSSGSRLVINPNFNGVSESCMLISELSVLDSARIDTVKYTLNVIPHQGGQYIKSLQLEGTGMEKLIAVSNDGLNPFIFDKIPTLVVLDQEYNEPVIGLAKELIAIEKIEDDVFDVGFRFTVKNYSDTTITDLQIQDNLSQVFGDSVSIESFQFYQVPNNWVINDGSIADSNLLIDTQSTISPFTTQHLNLKVRLKFNSRNTLVFENFGVVIGKIKDKEIFIQDISTDGRNPDSNFSGSPQDDSVTTVIDFRRFYAGEITALGIAKSGQAELTSTGGTKISYTVIVQNFGTEDLIEISLMDDLKRVFGNNTQFDLISGPVVDDSSTLQPNAEYDGVTNIDLLAQGSILKGGQSDTLHFSVSVSNINDVSQTYRNQIIGTAKYAGNEVMDLSVSGLQPDADGDGDPGNDSGYTINVVDSGIIDSSAVNLIIAEVISPNGDGINDEWVIQAEAGGVPLNRMGMLKVEILNRWGHPVYQSDDYISDFAEGKGWKGQANVGVIISKGSVLPDGTYFYSISSSENWVFKGRKKVGYITLKR